MTISTTKRESSSTLTRSLTVLNPRRRSARSGPSPLVWGAFGILALAAAMELIPLLGLVNPRHFPPLHEILGALFERLTQEAFWTALGSTVGGWLLGLLIAAVIGVIAGITIGSIPIVDRLFSSTIEFLRPIPSIALVPLAALLFGATMQSTGVLVVFASVWPILIQVVYGVRDVDRVALDTASTYRLGAFRTVSKVIWPSMMPYFIVGVRLAASIALVLEITGELVIGSPGIGRLITVAQSSAAIPSMYAYILVAAILGVVINVVTRVAERRILFWHASIRGEAAGR